MIDLSDVFNNRLTKTTNFLINLNFLIMYKAQFNNFNQTDYSEFINNNEKVYSSYMNGLSGSLYSNIILKNNDYELNNPCLTTDINVSYYLIDCNDYKIRNGLSFMILQINNYLVNIYNYFIRVIIQVIYEFSNNFDWIYVFHESVYTSFLFLF